MRTLDTTLCSAFFTKIKSASLGVLEQLGRQAHEQVIAGEGAVLMAAITSGLTMSAAKERGLVCRGQLTAFYIGICGSKQTASVYMTLAKYRALIEENVQRAGPMSIRAALELIREHEGKSRPPRSKPERSPTPWSTMSDAEVTAELVALGFERFLQTMPPEWRTRLGERSGGQVISLLQAQHPNMKLKSLKKRKILRLVHDADNSPPTPPTTH